MKLIAVLTTVEKSEDAKRLAQVAVESRLAACAQIDEVQSTYFWKGVLENTHEFRIALKSRAALWPELRTRILASHPYETPAVYSIDVAETSEQYLDWVLQNTREPAPCPN
jgi:periplasmic divalent cation tolerance protein